MSFLKMGLPAWYKTKEKLIREVLKACQEYKILPKDFDPYTVNFDEILTPPNVSGGLRILALTEGPGEHSFESDYMLSEESIFIVPEKEIYITLNTLGFLSGWITTFCFKKEEGKLKLIKDMCHIIS